MKTAIIFLVVLFAKPSIEDEKEAVSNTLNYYMEGGTNRSFETLKKAFHPDAIMTINDEEKGLRQVNAREFFSKMKPGDPIKRTCKIVSIDIEGTTAIARLHLEDDKKIFHDFMTLLKVDGNWVIVNKSFYTEYK